MKVIIAFSVKNHFLEVIFSRIAIIFDYKTELTTLMTVWSVSTFSAIITIVISVLQNISIPNFSTIG